MEKLLLSERDVGDIFAISRSTVRRLMAEGRLPSIKIGRALRFHIQDVEALAEELRGKPDADDRGV